LEEGTTIVFARLGLRLGFRSSLEENVAKSFILVSGVVLGLCAGGLLGPVVGGFGPVFVSGGRDPMQPPIVYYRNIIGCLNRGELTANFSGVSYCVNLYYNTSIWVFSFYRHLTR
jgi:hypothetical protein